MTIKTTTIPLLATPVAVALVGAGQGALLMHDSFESHAISSNLIGHAGAEAGQVGNCSAVALYGVAGPGLAPLRRR
jgi:hypothetical protein